MYFLRERKITSYAEENELSQDHTPRQNVCKRERDILNYMLVEAMKKKRQEAVQTISVAISSTTEKKLIDQFAIKRSFAPNEQFFENFDLNTVSMQKNKQQLFEVAYKKTANRLDVKIRKKKPISIELEDGSTAILQGMAYLVIRFKITNSVVNPQI